MKAAGIAGLLALLSLSPLEAAPTASAKSVVLPGQVVELKTEDGWTLKARYVSSGNANQTFVLLHGRGQRKELWIRLAKALEKAGYGYLGLDFRGHGESSMGPDGQSAPWRTFKVTKTENDYEKMSRDIASAMAWLIAQKVPEETIGLIGTDVGGSLGLKYAAVHSTVSPVVMLSPGTHYQEILTVNAIRAYKNRPILMVYSEADRFAARDAPVLYAFAKMAAGDKNASVISLQQLPGIRLPQNRPVINQIISWLRNPIKTDAPATSTPTAAGKLDASPEDQESSGAETEPLR